MTDLAMVLAVSGAAGFQAHRLLRLRQRPQLRLKVAEKQEPMQVRASNRPALVWTIQLENAGSEPALGCHATIDRLELFDGALWRPHPGFAYPLPLPWSIAGSKARLDLSPGAVTPELPLLLTWLDAPKLRLVTPLDISSGFMLEYPAGTYRLTVLIRTESNPNVFARRRFQVKFDGTPRGLRLEAVPE
ncbi:MAG: hypothetical protein P8049_01730 [Gemmatimonadota bacterium]